MNDSQAKRPSRFALSRFMLNECDDGERAAIEAWIASSDAAREEYESFRSSVAKEERSAPGFGVLIGKAHEFGAARHIRRPAFRPAVVAAAALVAFAGTFGGLVLIYRSASTTSSYVERLGAAPDTSMTLRDTLEALRRIAGAFSLPGRTIGYADSGAVPDRVLSCRQPPRRTFCGADQTALWGE